MKYRLVLHLHHETRTEVIVCDAGQEMTREEAEEELDIIGERMCNSSYFSIRHDGAIRYFAPELMKKASLTMIEDEE